MYVRTITYFSMINRHAITIYIYCVLKVVTADLILLFNATVEKNSLYLDNFFFKPYRNVGI